MVHNIYGEHKGQRQEC